MIETVLGTTTGIVLAVAILLRSLAWSIREAGPEVRKWKKRKK